MCLNEVGIHSRGYGGWVACMAQWWRSLHHSMAIISGRPESVVEGAHYDVAHMYP